MEKRTFRAVFFDLDGTLLPMDVDVFMKSYFRALGGYVARMGIAPDQFMAGMKRGITAMATNDSGHANAESFWPEFLACIDLPEGVTADALQAAIGDFYENEFGELGADVQPNPAAARAIEAAGLEGRDVLMVGNNTKEDLAACQLGCEGFLVTDFLIDPVGFEVFSVRHGSMEKFADWVNSLPECADPAQGVSDAIVPAAARERVLAACGIADGQAGGAKTLEEAGRSGGADFVINGMED